MSTKPAGKKAARGGTPAPNKKPRRRNPRLTDQRADAFIEHLARTGSVTVAAEQAGIGRTQIYEHRRTHKRFAKAWTKALGLGVERLHDNAITRALEGDERPIVRKGEVIGTERRIDNRLVQFLLKVHKPEFSGGAPAASQSEQEALAKRLKAAAKRLEAHRARQEKKREGQS
ncbi:hypothetical protein [Reyranella sp.]|uniref:hypothetical protein n=1 Tax=Reyranella sp. TaxID=1929291 RepID=UPI002731699A|nr:hypothetical protein [Reyranella sp.]MDP2376426.1 hypothetical protein [Reyranella sp.]